MKRILAVFVLMLAVSALVYTEVQAQALQLAKPFTGKVNKAIASTLGKRMNTLGFAANDPIYGATLAAAETVVAGSIAAGSVAATVAAVGSAPVWLSVALGIGAAYEIYDFSVGQFEVKADSSTQRVSLASGTIYKAPPLPAVYAPVYTEITTDLPYDYADPGVGNRVAYPNDQKICAVAGAAVLCGNTVADIENQAFIRYVNGLVPQYNYNNGTESKVLTSNVPGVSSGPTKVVCTLSPINCPEAIRYNYSRSFTTNYTLTYYLPPPAESFDVSTVTSYSFSVFNNPNYVDTSKAYTLNDAAAKFQDSDLSTVADPELLAAIANKLWQQAAQQPDYEGVPYDNASPITAEDILADIALGLYPHPTIYDLLSLPSPDATTAPQLDPEAVPVPATSPDGASTVDLGPDPNIAPPVLEEAPSGVDIVTYVIGLLPSFSSFTMPPRCLDTGGVCECTAPQFEFYDNQYSLQSMCDLLEEQRFPLSSIFSALWGIFSLTLVLRA